MDRPDGRERFEEGDIMNGQLGGIAAQERMGHAVRRVLPAIQAAVLIVSIAAAIPTAHNLYYSWINGIPFREVPHRLAQYDLWMKNLECKIEYRSLLTASGNKVQVGACQKTGDIAIKISGDAGRAAYEWIAFDQLQKPGAQTASILGLLVPAANAAGLGQLASTAGTGMTRLAQDSGMEVLCQAKHGDKVVRIVKDGGKCYRETVSPMKGGIDKSEEVSCDTRC
jgi:hypothetical protein